MKMMILVIGVILCAQSCFAQGGKEAVGIPGPTPGGSDLYASLSVSEASVTFGGEQAFSKTVGGLSCVHSEIIAPNYYFCSLNTEQENAEAIYGALFMKPVDISQGVGSEVLQKAAGNLECTMTRVVSQKAELTYNCVFN